MATRHPSLASSHPTRFSRALRAARCGIGGADENALPLLERGATLPRSLRADADFARLDARRRSTIPNPGPPRVSRTGDVD
jgi:hypothetical protein